MQTITRSYRIRTYPNGAQRRLRDRWFGAYRWLWNTALEIRTAAYRECGLTLTGNDISCWLTQWKQTAGHEWLKLVPATCLTQCLRDQDAAFRNFFAGRAQYPKFKRKGSAGRLRFQDAGTGWQRGVLKFTETWGPETRRIAAIRRSTGSGDADDGCGGTVFRELLRRSRESPALALVLGTRRGRGSRATSPGHALDRREDR